MNTHGHRFQQKRDNKTHVPIIPYFIHSKKRDFSFTPGLNSSLLKLSLLVNGSMPTLQCGPLTNHNRQPASSPTKSYVAFRATHFLSTPNDSWESLCLLLRDSCALHLQRNKFVLASCFQVSSVLSNITLFGNDEVVISMNVQYILLEREHQVKFVEVHIQLSTRVKQVQFQCNVVSSSKVSF